MQGLQSIGMMKELNYHFHAHVHDEWEIAYYYYGTGVNIIGDERYPIEPGVILCQPPGIPHSEQSKDGYMNIFLTLRDFSDLGVKVPCFKDTVNKDFYHLLLQLYHVFHGKPTNWTRISECILDTLYEYMVSWKKETRKSPLVESFERKLVSNISSRTFNLGHAFKDMPMSVDHFRRLFQKETGRTPVKYLTELRINYAKQLLENRHNLIKDVACLAGYEDSYYFSRVFKKTTGKSPEEWKESHGRK